MKNENEFDFDIAPTIELTSYVMRVKAGSKEEALKKINEIGFNAGERMCSCYKPKKGKPRFLP